METARNQQAINWNNKTGRQRAEEDEKETQMQYGSFITGDEYHRLNN